MFWINWKVARSLFEKCGKIHDHISLGAEYKVTSWLQNNWMNSKTNWLSPPKQQSYLQCNVRHLTRIAALCSFWWRIDPKWFTLKWMWLKITESWYVIDEMNIWSYEKLSDEQSTVPWTSTQCPIIDICYICSFSWTIGLTSLGFSTMYFCFLLYSMVTTAVGRLPFHKIQWEHVHT